MKLRIEFFMITLDYERLAERKFDFIIANDIETLPLAFAFPGKPKVIFDAHEYAPRHFEDKKMWRIFFQDFNTWLCRKYIPKTTHDDSWKRVALEYEKNFHVKPTVITNANNFFEMQPGPTMENKIGWYTTVSQHLPESLSSCLTSWDCWTIVLPWI